MYSPLPRTCEEKTGRGSAPALFRKVSGLQPAAALSGETPAGSGSDRGSHLVESGVGNHVGMDAQRALNHASEHAGNLGKFVLFVIFGVGAAFPEAIGLYFLSPFCGEGHFGQE